MTIEFLRTPDECFAHLPDWPYAPHYLESLPGYEGLRLAYVDEGPADAPVILCLHGQPTWSFLYRKMIPVFVEAGYRVLAASEAVAQAYGAPFPDARYKAGVRRFPQLVAITPDMPGAVPAQQAASFWSNEWNGPTFMAVGAKDPVLGPQAMSWMRTMIRGCPEPLVLEDEGHFVQESGEIVARAALSAFGRASEPDAPESVPDSAAPTC